MASQTEQLFFNGNPIDSYDDEMEKIVDLAGYQVTKAELFAHTREPAITIWDSHIKFNMSSWKYKAKI